MTNDVSKPSGRYLELKALRDLPRTLLGGTPAMQKAGQRYLPRHPAESDGSYQVRLQGTELYNAYAKAISAVVGKFFAKPISLADDMPEVLVQLAENIDLEGRGLNAFAWSLFTEAMIDGVAFILTDHPRSDGILTLADERARNLRPYAVIITADQLIGHRVEPVNGIPTLTQARIAETMTEPDGEFGERTVNRVRVLYPGRYQVYTETEQGYELTEEGAVSLPYIPLRPVYTHRTGFFEGKPPYRSLAELNREHWNSTSEQRNALTLQRFGMLATIGADDETPIEVGPNKVIRLPRESDAKYLEPTGAGITLGFTDLDRIEQRMQSVSVELRIERGGQVTATAAAIDSAESNATLAAIAEGLKDALENMFIDLGAYLGIEQTGSVVVNTEFDAGRSNLEDLKVLAADRARGDLSRDTYWKEQKRRGVLADDFDEEAEAARLENEGPALSSLFP